jgi:glycine/D-amino acid oxidase-like deaminating enzyme
LHCEVLVAGAGITGALMAERLTRQGLDVAAIDREDPTQGSTVASTAMLLWEIDASRTVRRAFDSQWIKQKDPNFSASRTQIDLRKNAVPPPGFDALSLDALKFGSSPRCRLPVVSHSSVGG